jgi:hypothetical protein
LDLGLGLGLRYLGELIGGKPRDNFCRIDNFCSFFFLLEATETFLEKENMLLLLSAAISFKQYKN